VNVSHVERCSSVQYDHPSLHTAVSTLIVLETVGLLSKPACFTFYAIPCAAAFDLYSVVLFLTSYCHWRLGHILQKGTVVNFRRIFFTCRCSSHYSVGSVRILHIDSVLLCIMLRTTCFLFSVSRVTVLLLIGFFTNVCFCVHWSVDPNTCTVRSAVVACWVIISMNKLCQEAEQASQACCSRKVVRKKLRRMFARKFYSWRRLFTKLCVRTPCIKLA